MKYILFFRLHLLIFVHNSQTNERKTIFVHSNNQKYSQILWWSKNGVDWGGGAGDERGDRTSHDLFFQCLRVDNHKLYF